MAISTPNLMRRSTIRVRTAFLNQQGYRVIRFSNHEVNTDLATVLDAIYAALANS